MLGLGGNARWRNGLSRDLPRQPEVVMESKKKAKNSKKGDIIDQRTDQGSFLLPGWSWLDFSWIASIGGIQNQIKWHDSNREDEPTSSLRVKVFAGSLFLVYWLGLFISGWPMKRTSFFFTLCEYGSTSLSELETPRGTRSRLLRRGNFSQERWEGHFPDSWFKWGRSRTLLFNFSVSTGCIPKASSEETYQEGGAVLYDTIYHWRVLFQPFYQNWCWSFIFFDLKLNSERLANKTVV